MVCADQAEHYDRRPSEPCPDILVEIILMDFLTGHLDILQTVPLRASGHRSHCVSSGHNVLPRPCDSAFTKLELQRTELVFP